MAMFTAVAGAEGGAISVAGYGSIQEAIDRNPGKTIPD